MAAGRQFAKYDKNGVEKTKADNKIHAALLIISAYSKEERRNMRPNIIIFNPDEMRADTVGHLGGQETHTPFLDQMAGTDAVSFRHAFCQNPVCVPSRCSFTTGLYPHVRGHRTMAYLLREGEESIFSELKQAGYYVWMNARNDLVAAQKEGLLEKHASEIYYSGKVPKASGPIKSGTERSPLDFAAMYNGELRVDEHGKNYSQDDEDLDAAIERIRKKPEGQPLCLFLGLNFPHPPYQVEEPYFSMIDRSKIKKRIQAEDGIGKAKIEEAIRKNQKLQDYTEEQWTELRAVYLGMTAKIDAQFWKLCDALKEAGEYDNSAIFFFSDHGDFTGDYGIAEKAQNAFEDCLTNVPFLIKPPKDCQMDPGVSDSLVELVDFYATAMDLAGVTPAHTHYGHSLREVLKDRKKEIREFVTCEGGRNPEEIHCDEFHAGGPKGTTPYSPYYARHLAQTDPEAHAKGFMIRTKTYKYVGRVNGADEFYDLTQDPEELYNRIHDEKYCSEIRKMERNLRLWLMRTTDIVPFDYDKRFSEKMVWEEIKRMVPPEYTEEFKEKIRKGTNKFLIVAECQKRFGNYWNENAE